MVPAFEVLTLLVLVAILVVLIGLLTAIKKGFNEVIVGLEALDLTVRRREGTGPSP